MRANFKYNLCWLIVMIAGFYLINTLILVGVINAFIENMLVTIGINIILAVGLNLVIGFAGQFSLGHAGLWQSAPTRQLSLRRTMQTLLAFGPPLWSVSSSPSWPP